VVASNAFWAIVSGGSIGMPWKNYFLNAMGWYIVFAGFTILYFFFGNWWALQAERERAMRSDTLAREARLQMLRYQLNPHFLFNALGTIRSVLYEDVGRADRLVTELSDFLRYTLVEEDRLEVKLGQELDTIQNYLTIQQMRFEEKLETTICAGEEARAWTIPAFLIHPLVENAIKYGMRTSTLPLRVSVDARVVDGALRVAVVNSGRLVDGRADGLENGAGIGLKNVRLHLEHFFPERHAFTLEERGGEVHAVLTVEPEHEHAG
jgi:two-component system LytT family sensor kinase